MPDSRFQTVTQAVQSEMSRLPIPGVAVGVMVDGVEHIAGFGITSVEYPTAVTANTLYQIGSISKTFLGTLVMRLVEMGKLDLNAPLKTYLPELKLADPTVADNVTLYHCLTHTGGWEGDYFDTFGNGDDALARMVATMVKLPQLTPLGKIWSYNNAGFYLAGRAIEIVTGMTFEQAMQQYIFDPLQLDEAYYFAEDVISRHFVVGHEKENDKPIVARPWALARTANPAGGIVTNVPMLFRYARFHMGDGTAPDGTRLLSQTFLQDMQQARFRSIDPQSVGLTWYMRDVGGYKMLGHGGGTNGQNTNFQIIPAKNMSFAILTNSDHGTVLINTVTRVILEQYLSIPPSEDTPLLIASSDLSSFTGTYVALLDEATVTVENDELVVQVHSKGGFPTPSDPPPPTQPPPVRASFYGEDKIFLKQDPYKGVHAEFIRSDDGKIEWLRLFGRIHRKA